MCFLFQQLQSKINERKHSVPSGVSADAKELINEYIVRNIHHTSNQLFKQDPLQSVKNFFSETFKKE